MAPDSRSQRPLLILVAAPYRSGTDDDPWLVDANVAVMAEVSLRLLRAGHLPVVSEWLALPLIEHAGSGQIGDQIFNSIFETVAAELLDKCDAILRIGGPSEDADDVVATAWNRGKTVYFALEDVPPVHTAAISINRGRRRSARGPA
ncbi:MAG: DUF4406 domain-containing protein [Gemmatimonadaceae bacterium]